MFILSSSGLEFWPVNLPSIHKNSKVNIFKNKKFLGEISSNLLFIRNECIQDSWIFLIIVVTNITMK